MLRQEARKKPLGSPLQDPRGNHTGDQASNIGYAGALSSYGAGYLPILGVAAQPCVTLLSLDGNQLFQ